MKLKNVKNKITELQTNKQKTQNSYHLTSSNPREKLYSQVFT